jgi:2-dehydropantoate 2-reductase
MSSNNITFILHKPQLSENIGACARGMKNFNFQKLTVINPKPIFPNDKILATSVGAKNIINKSKVFDTLEPALKSIKNIINDKTVFMSFQNGIGHEAIIKSIVGDEKVIGGTTTQASNILGPGHIMNHAALPSWIGEYDGGITDRITEIADTFTAHNLEMIAAEDVKKRKWMKLFALTAIGPLSAIFDLHHIDLYINNNANDVSRSLGKEIILETRDVALADGVDVSEDECLFMFNKIVDSKQTNKSSMAFDVLYKRKTEIDFISGAVSKIGKKHGIATPLNDLMYKMIRVKEGMYS